MSIKGLDLLWVFDHTGTMYKPNGKTFEQNIKQMCLSAHLWLRKKHLKDVTVKYKKSLARDVSYKLLSHFASLYDINV